MRYGLIDSGLGLLGCAAALLDVDPAAQLVLALDPEGMPYGARAADDVIQRALGLAYSVAAYEPDVIVVACNTASVYALDAVRADFEPDIPVVGTVPAIKPAAATGRSIAVWATVRTSGSAYQRRLIERFAPGVAVAEVACPGFAEAIEAADRHAVAAAISAAVEATPPHVDDVVLGCTHYPLVSEQIRVAFGHPVVLHDSATAVALQARRRASAGSAAAQGDPTGDDTGGQAQTVLGVISSGQGGRLPDRVLEYPTGRRVASVASSQTAPLAAAGHRAAIG